MSTATLTESPAASRMLPRYRELGYPEIAPLPEGADRPFWSVMIPTFNCAELLRLTLAAVLTQDPGPDQMPVEVIVDGSPKDDPEAVVREVGGGRVAFYRQPKNLGATGNFNSCLERSRGRYVQVLHGDDLVQPGFYAAMRALLESHPEAGSAHCQFAIIDDDGYWTGLGEVVHRARW
jgi:glycosyltransferase involved in cell wall biosynthesis